MEKSQNSKAVIFDLDGVLINTGEFHRLSWHDLAREEGFEMTDEFFYRTFGMQNYQIISQLVDKELPRAEIDAMGQRKEEYYRQRIAGQLTLMEGVEELLADLKSKGFRMAIGSSTPRVNLEFMLDNIKVHGYFEAYVTGEEVSNGKPAPDTFLKAAEKLALPAGRCVVVEDAVQGVQAGKAAGMAVVAITTTRPRKDLEQADKIVDSMTELSAGDFRELLS